MTASLAANENNPTFDFGFYAPCTGVIGDRVWFDTNRNGIQDSGETRHRQRHASGLLNSGHAVIATAITDANGNYTFLGLCAGSYTVVVDAATLPAAVVPTLTSPPGAGTPSTDSNGSPAAVTLATPTPAT